MKTEIKKMVESVAAMNAAVDDLTKTCNRTSDRGIETRLCSLETSIRSMSRAVEAMAMEVLHG